MLKIIIKLIIKLLLCLSIISCSSKNILNYKYKLRHNEETKFKKENIITLYNNIYFHLPRNVIDGGGFHRIKIQISDTIVAKQKKKLNFQNDYLIINGEYQTYTYLWENDPLKINGEIEILEWNNTFIKIKLNAWINDSDNKLMYFISGKRKYKLSIK